MFLIWAPGTYGENGHILKPYGGIVDLGDGVIRKVTDEIYLFIKSVIKADNPIEIEGTKQLILTINANDLWEEDFILESISNIDYEGSEYIIFDGLYPLSLTELNQFIKSVEDELELRTGNYTIEIKPAVEGKIYTANQTIAIDESAFSTVNLSSDIILSETENQFRVSTPIKDTIEIPQFLYLFKYKIPVNTFKYIIIIVYTLFIFVMAIINLKKIIDKKKQQSEVELFNKKYKARLINVNNNINNLNHYNIVELDALNKILILSDEKDCSIFKYENNNEATYYITDQFNIYYHKIIKEVITDEVIDCVVNEMLTSE